MSGIKISIFGALLVGWLTMGYSATKLTAPPALFKENKSAKNVQAKPKILSDRVIFGEKSLVMDQKGHWLINTAGKRILKDSYYIKIADMDGIGVDDQRVLYDKKFDYNQAEKKFTYSCKFQVGDKHKVASFIRTVKLVADNLLQVDMTSTIPQSANVSYQHMTLMFPFAVCDGGTVIVNGKAKQFSQASAPKTSRPKKIFSGIVKTLSFTPEVISTSFKMKLLTKNYCSIKENRNGSRAAMTVIRISPDKNGKISYLLDLRSNRAAAMKKSTDSYAGIDFWRNDRMHVPNFNYSRNLLRNASFEAGLRYYSLINVWGDDKPQPAQPVYSTTAKERKFGHHALEITAISGRTRLGFLQTFAIPVVPGKKYTFSFYIKAEKANSMVQMRAITSKWMQFPEIGNYSAPVGEWQRHHVTFTAPNSAVTILMRGTYSGKQSGETGKIWLDGLQLEAGAKCTEWVPSSPLAAVLVTSNKDNFLLEGEAIQAKMKLVTTPNTVGKLKCSLVNFFYQQVWQGDFTFKTDKNGNATVKLPLDFQGKKGIYVLDCKFTLGNKVTWHDFFRFSYMKPAPIKFLNEDIMTLRTMDRISRKEDLWKRYTILGVKGFYGNCALSQNKQLFDIITKKYHFKQFSAVMYTRSGRIGDAEFDFKNMPKVTPQIEKEVEEACYQKAKKYPWIKVWIFSDEPEAGSGSKFHALKTGNFADFAKLLLACRRGVKRLDPNKLVILDGACNMSPADGIRWVNNWLNAVTKMAPNEPFDGSSIHPYRTLPEDPDLDNDTKIFVKMLSKYGYDKIPIYWNGAIYYKGYNIPEWNLSPYRGCSTDHWRCNTCTYDMGWGERIAAAYAARSWLVGLKYQDHIKHMNNWTSVTFIDANLTPLALQKIPNTLANILGNATFKQDIRFAPQCRAYLFEDEQQRPVAAVWSYMPKVDHGLEPAPMVSMKITGQVPVFIDLMGNSHQLQPTANGTIKFPLSPYPVFIRGAAGSLKSLAKSLADCRITGSNISPVKLFVNPVTTSNISVQVKNMISRPIRGKGTITVQSKITKQKLNLASRGAEKRILPLSKPITYSAIGEIPVIMDMKLNGKRSFKANGTFSSFAIKKSQNAIAIDGKLNDWRNIQYIKLKNRYLAKGMKNITDNDFSARFKMTWDKDNLYLLLEVTDNELFTLPRKTISHRYMNDSVQLYIDTLNDARAKATKGFDGNDYEYDLFPDSQNNSIQVFRRLAPDPQLAGGLLAPKANTIAKRVKAVFTKTAHGYTYEVAFPQRTLMPMRLKAGTTVGFGLFLNDNDNNKWCNGLTSTPPQTSCYMKPHLYPVMLLTK
jgi:hypothetical protein